MTDARPLGGSVTRRHGDEALTVLLAGQPVEVAEMPPVDCEIRFTRRRNAR